MTVFTVDVSSHDGPIDWAQVRAAGIVGAAVKATEGDGARVRYTNPLFAAQFRGALAAGLAPVLAYHCLAAGNLPGQVDMFAGVTNRAGWFTERVGGMVDVEPFPELVRASITPSYRDLEGFCQIWWQRYQLPLAVYLPVWVWNQWGKPLLNLPGRPVLISSNYPTIPAGDPAVMYQSARGDTGPGWAPYGGRTPALWQFTSTGRVPGIHGGTGDCDVNAFRGTAAELLHLLTLEGTDMQWNDPTHLPADLAGRSPDTCLIDLWSNETLGSSAYVPGTPSLRAAQLNRIESTALAVQHQLDQLAAGGTSLDTKAVLDAIASLAATVATIAQRVEDLGARLASAGHALDVA